MFWIAIASLISPASAQESPPTEPAQAQLDRARELYDNGKSLFDEANYRDSILAWEESYRLSNRPALLFNIANAHERLGEYSEAIEVLNRYRAFATEEERESISRRMRNLERLQAEQEEKIAAAQPAPAPQPVQVTPVQPAPVPATPAPTEKKANGRVIAGAALIGVGIAGIGTGVALGLTSTAAAARLDNHCTEDQLCLRGAENDLNTNRDTALFADLSFGVGAVAAIGGVILLVSKPKAQLRVGWNSLEYRGSF